MKVYILFTEGSCGHYGESRESGVFADRSIAEATMAHLTKAGRGRGSYVAERDVQFAASHDNCDTCDCRTAKRRYEKRIKVTA